MKLKYNIHIVVFFSMSVLYSCKDNKELTEDEKVMTYTVIIKENDQNSTYLKDNIRVLLSQDKDSLSPKYDRLTADYIQYLETLESEFEKNTPSIFFDGEMPSLKGKEFLKKTELYKTEVEKLAPSENFRKRLNLILNTNNVRVPEKAGDVADNNENNNIEVAITYFLYLDYYYKGLTTKQVLAFISNKKVNLLQLENEFLIQSTNK